MEKKLKIKELAPYLPYGLKVQITENKAITEVLSLDAHRYKDQIRIETDLGAWGCSYFKPLLRPLSCLTEEIEHNGEGFVPMVELEKIHKGIFIYQPLNLGYPIEITIQTEDYSQEIDLYDGYLIIQKLHEWHFDVFGLIGRGLALPIDGKEVKS